MFRLWQVLKYTTASMFWLHTVIAPDHPVLLGNVHDRKEGIAEKIRDGLEVADLVITTGCFSGI